ncbi:MAG: DUF4328 domain-containing protein [Acidimicrobiales bacterium]
MAAEGTPRGWYTDPWKQGDLRWWDGNTWTGHFVSSMPRSAPALQEETIAARRARIALLVAIPTGILMNVGFHFAIDDIRRFIREFDAVGGSSTWEFDRSPFYLLSQVANLAQIVIGVLFLMWFHQSAVNARAVGLPARRQPGTGVAGFLIPVLNLWWPYQSTCDLFPPGHPARRRVLRWFLLWVVGGFVSAAAMVIGGLTDGWTGWLYLIVPLVQLPLAALTAREVISEAVEVHASLAGTSR